MPKVSTPHTPKVEFRTFPVVDRTCVVGHYSGVIRAIEWLENADCFVRTLIGKLHVEFFVFVHSKGNHERLHRVIRQVIFRYILVMIPGH